MKRNKNESLVVYTLDLFNNNNTPLSNQHEKNTHCKEVKVPHINIIIIIDFSNSLFLFGWG